LPIYLDHSASRKPYPEVLALFARTLENHFANPSSTHTGGQEAQADLAASKKQIAACIGCLPEELALTSGGTESINWALKGLAIGNPRMPKRIITSCGEHAAIRETCLFLERQGWSVEVIKLCQNGQVDLDDLARALQKPAALISMIHVSNETGAVNAVADLVRLRDELAPQTLIHLDAVQTLGKFPFHFSHSGVDLLSGSGHKCGAPKGIGWLAIRRGIRLEPLIHGGGQQQGRRSGTENPPLAAACALATQMAVDRQAGQVVHVRLLRRLFLDALTAENCRLALLSPPDGIPHILAVAFPGIPGPVMQRALASQSIMVSTGAACSSRRSAASPVLLAMGVAKPLAECAIRISLSDSNSTTEIEQAAQAVAAICRKLSPSA
jgi:cysteine desulfurase